MMSFDGKQTHKRRKALLQQSYRKTWLPAVGHKDQLLRVCGRVWTCVAVCGLLTLVKKEVSRSSDRSTVSSSKKLGGMKLRRRCRPEVPSPNVRPWWTEQKLSYKSLSLSSSLLIRFQWSNRILTKSQLANYVVSVWTQICSCSSHCQLSLQGFAPLWSPPLYISRHHLI